MKVKINHTLFITLSLITLLIAGNYWGIAQFVLPYKARLYILVLSGAIPLLLPLYYKKRSIILNNEIVYISAGVSSIGKAIDINKIDFELYIKLVNLL